MGHNPFHDGLDAIFRRMGGDKNAMVKYKRNQEKERGRRGRSNGEFEWEEGYYHGRHGSGYRTYQRPDAGPQQPLINNFQNAPLMPLRSSPNGLPQVQGPPPIIGIPQAGVQHKFIARYRGGQRQLVPNPLYVPGAQQFPPGPPLSPFPQAQPGPPSYHPSAAAAPEPPSRAPTQASSQHQSSSAKPQSSQRVQSSQREPSSYSTLESPPPYKTVTKSSSQRPSSQREPSSHSTLKPSSQSHHSTKSSERPSGAPTKAVKTEHYKLGGMQRTIVEGQVASSKPSNSKTRTVVSKTHDYRLGKMERTIVEGQVPGSKSKGRSER